VLAVLAKLRRLAPFTRAVPVDPLLQIGLPGKSFHVGGSFPMTARPGELESDVLGRPAGMRRVHVVDAAAFPSIPATTITLSVMANAARVAARHDED
jgi:choline dehydrogenase-like flavoprotein